MAPKKHKLLSRNDKTLNTEPNQKTTYEQLQFCLREHITTEQAKHELQKISAEPNHFSPSTKQRSISVETRKNFYEYGNFTSEGLNEGWEEDKQKWLNNCSIRELQTNGGKFVTNDISNGSQTLQQVSLTNPQKKLSNNQSSKFVKSTLLKHIKYNRKASKIKMRNSPIIHTPKAHTKLENIPQYKQKNKSMIMQPISKFKSTQTSKINIEPSSHTQQKITRKHYHCKSKKFNSTIDNHESVLKTNIRFKHNFILHNIHSQNKESVDYSAIKQKKSSVIALMPTIVDNNDEYKIFDEYKEFEGYKGIDSCKKFDEWKKFDEYNQRNNKMTDKGKNGFNESQSDVRSNLKELKRITKPYLGNKNSLSNDNSHNFYRKQFNKIIVAQKTTGNFIIGKQSIEGNCKRCHTVQFQDSEINLKKNTALQRKYENAESRHFTRMIDEQKDMVKEEVEELPIRIFQLTYNQKNPSHKSS